MISKKILESFFLNSSTFPLSYFKVISSVNQILLQHSFEASKSLLRSAFDDICYFQKIVPEFTGYSGNFFWNGRIVIGLLCPYRVSHYNTGSAIDKRVLQKFNSFYNVIKQKVIKTIQNICKRNTQYQIVGKYVSFFSLLLSDGNGSETPPQSSISVKA